MAFEIGDAVYLPREFCPGCGDYVEEHTGLIVRYTPAGDVHWQLVKEHPGPYYGVLISHAHSGSGNLVYAEQELRAVTPR